MPMQIILLQDVSNLGKAGELVTVKPGYGRNYLLPEGLAVSASARNVTRLEHERKVIEKRVAKAGELVTVKPGYGRNYLLPEGLAVSASARNVTRLEHERKVIEKRVAK